MTVQPSPTAPAHLPFFITGPGQTDVLFYIVAVFVLVCVIALGIIFLTIHSLPERMAHRAQKVQFDIVAVLCLLALFTHEHVFWVAALLLAFIDLPDFSTPVQRIVTAVETIAEREGVGSVASSEIASEPSSALTDGAEPAASGKAPPAEKARTTKGALHA